MDGNGQMAPHNQQQQQQQPSVWYGGPHQYHLPPPPQPMQWQYSHDRPPSYSQQPPLPPMYHHQPDFYSQPHQQQHYSAPPNQQQHLQPPQHGQFYAQQNQGWPSSNGWNNQFSYHGPAVGLGQEEDWAAKARAWAAAKAAQEAAQQAQFQPQAIPAMEQPYQDSLPKVDPLQSSLQPPGQEVSLTYNHAEANVSYNQDAPSSYAPSSNSNFMQDVTLTVVKEDVPLSSFARNLTSMRVQPLSHPQLVVSSSFSEDVSSSYGQETLPTGPANQQQLSPQQASVPQLAHQHQQQSHAPLLASSGPQHQQHSAYSESPGHYEFNSQQQFEFQQHQSQEFQQQPAPQYMPPIQSMAMDAPDVGYGGPTLSVQVWPSIGGPVMPFVPNMGPGLNGGPIPSQFEQHNHPHLQAAHQMHGPQSPHMFARPLPPHGPGFQPGGPPLGVPFGFGGSPSLGPGPGAGIQPLFMADGNGHLGGPDRPKKAAVPSWLREELLKKRAAAALGGLTSSAYPDELVQANGDEAAVTPIRKSNRKTESSGLSDSEEEKDEDEVEAARTTAINQEIKRVLTEVLLKVTDSLFDEIAQEVLGEEAAEDDYVPLQAQDPQADPANQGKRSVSVEPVGQGSVVRAAASPPPPEAPTPFAPTRVLVAPVKKSEQSGREDSESLTSNTPAGNVLGLANYASDDENDVQSGRESSAVKLEKHVEDAKDGRLSKIRRVDDVTEKKQEKVIETQRSLKEMEKTSGKEIGEESENWHKFERVKGRESDREREDRKEDRKEKDKERGRERERKENKERNEQKQWKERNRVNEAGNPHEQDGRSLRKPQPVEAEKPRASGQSEARGVEDTEFISRQSKIRSSHSRTVEVREQKHIQGVGEASGDKSLEPQDPSGHAEGFIPNTRSLPQGQSITEARLDRHNRGDRVRGADANMLDKFAKEGKVDIPEKGTMNSKRVFEKVSSLSDHPKTDGSRTEELEKLDKTRAREKAGGKSRDKESEKLHEKDKSKHENRMSDIGKAKDKAKDKKSQEADRRHNERGRADISREKKNENRDAKRSRRRSTSASGRGRSRSRSTSSRSLSSSLSPSRDDSPKRRKLHVGRSSKRRSISRSPIRSRRRSRSRSRSPRSKHSHRRVSPSPSRERDRHKRSRSGSPVRRRRRS